METVKYYEQPMYVWECPKCGHFNETAEDLAYEESVYCEGDDCHEEFKPEPE